MNLEDIKHDRLSEPERFLLDIFEQLVEYKNDAYPYNILYKMADKVMFKYESKNQILWYSYEYIHVVFCDEFGLNYKEIYTLVQSMMVDHIKLKVTATYFFSTNEVDEYLELM